jgi:tRNA(Ile)-lysidine synthase
VTAAAGVVGQVRQILGGPFPGLVVAVSGGPDSVALLRAVLGARGRSQAPVILAHLNHQLRGADSDGDEQFVIDLHEKLTAGGVVSLALVHQRLDVKAAAEGANLEAHARQLRYGWLAEVARTHGVGLVATGHTASDQAETVLHHLLRGTGVAGLRGISPRRELAPGIEVVRPLLRVGREEVLAYLGELGQGYRVDHSNTDTRFTRNRLRAELLPLLRAQYNPRVDEVLARLAEQADEVCREEEERARALLGEVELPRAGNRVILDTRRLGEARPRLVCTLLRLIWTREDWPTGEMGYDDWQRVAKLVWAASGAVDLPGRIRARRQGKVLQVGRIPPAS